MNRHNPTNVLSFITDIFCSGGTHLYLNPVTRKLFFLFSICMIIKDDFTQHHMILVSSHKKTIVSEIREIKTETKNQLNKNYWWKHTRRMLSYISYLVSSRDYCETHCTDRVPKVSAKKCHITPNWHKCHFIRHPAITKILKFQVKAEFRIPECH